MRYNLHKFIFVVTLCTIANVLLSDLVNFKELIGLATLIAAGIITFKEE